ncbi:serine/threonine-protein kinase [Nonomuraea polychroma]|uniref:non-specific serine/threonine protein kinase n=1 Tax=Nonomuraea polychroma TaxID=46176 RepID=A0A438LZY5_9ACTN|nr:serine/threonine-protein kinase [Nonomuraea polychroma]RVX38808.1 serine/threonine-protein kinase [Nonomuraea polychroma]
MPDVTPAMIAGRYVLIELIGQGGMAEVWRGHDQRLDVGVAVKIMNPLTGGIAAGERFARESKAAARIVHPNVVTVLDVGQDEQRRYLVMELLTGRSLAAELAVRGPLPVAEACHLLSQAAAGLDAAHRAGVVHRDVKPANLHLTADGRLKVVDFGLAHMATEASRLTTVGTIIGTPAYLAPEQIDGSGGEAATDIYALGCVAYELLCGRPPFTGSPAELVYQHVHHAPAPPGNQRPDIPIELERLILAMLAKNPADRPAGAEHVRQVFGAVAHAARARGRHAHQPTQVTPVPPPGAARARETRVLDAPPSGILNAGSPPGPGSSDGRRLLLQVAAAVAAIAVITLGATAVFSGSGDQAAAPPSATPSDADRVSEQPQPPATAKPSVRPTPSPTRTSTRPVARDPRTWLVALDQAVSAQQAQGGIDGDVAGKAHEKIREAAKKLVEGKTREAREKIQELGKDLAEARREGKLADGPLTQFLNRSGLVLAGEGAEEEDDD